MKETSTVGAGDSERAQASTEHPAVATSSFICIHILSYAHTHTHTHTDAQGGHAHGARTRIPHLPVRRRAARISSATTGSPGHRGRSGRLSGQGPPFAQRWSGRPRRDARPSSAAAAPKHHRHTRASAGEKRPGHGTIDSAARLTEPRNSCPRFLPPALSAATRRPPSDRRSARLAVSHCSTASGGQDAQEGGKQRAPHSRYARPCPTAFSSDLARSSFLTAAACRLAPALSLRGRSRRNTCQSTRVTRPAAGTWHPAVPALAKRYKEKNNNGSDKGCSSPMSVDFPASTPVARESARRLYGGAVLAVSVCVLRRV